MKLNIIYTFLFMLFIGHFTSAQTIEDALRFSQSENIGTARMLGAGGAYGALGGDQGAISINPATIATFKKSEFSISPMYLTSSTTSEFGDTRLSDNAASNTHFFNAGVIFSNKTRGSKWRSTNFGFTYNKISELDSRFSFDGVSEGTIMERFAERANGLGLDQLDPFEAGVAYDSWGIFDDDKDLNYSFDAMTDQEIRKKQTARYEGGISELAFTLGGNYKDQLHLGVTLGIPIFNFSSSKIYEESALDNRTPFRSLSYKETLSTSGSGINLKAGMIYTGIKPIRIGVSVATPRQYNLSDEYSTSMTYAYEIDSYSERTAESPEGNFDYSFSTPWTFNGSFAYLITGSTVQGFLSADIEYLNYKGGNFNLTEEGNDDLALQNDLNNQIDRELKGAVNVKLGGELAYDIFRVRAGYGLSSSPFANDNNLFSAISGGFGLRFDRFYVDLGARYQGYRQGYLPYISLNEENTQLVQLNTRKTHIVTTFGIKF